MYDNSFSYSLPVGSNGAELSIGYSKMHYAVDFADTNGVAKTFNMNLSYPFIRSHGFNLYGNIGYYSKQLQDKIGIYNEDERKRASVWSIGLSGDRRDKSNNGFTSFALTQSRGHLGMKSADAYLEDAFFQAAGQYWKTNLDIYRTKLIRKRLDFNFSFHGQLSSRNLDSSEKFSLGGANGVRAYPQGDASGDTGFLTSGELRWSMPTSKFQIATFVDIGRIRLNKHPLDDPKNMRSLAGAGFGLVWSQPGDYIVRLDYAFKISSEKAFVDKDKKGRIWLQAVKYF
jgi:hemolysin activation/secretion protein